MNIAKPLMYAVALASLSLAGCAVTPGEVEENIGSASQDALGFNALGFNALGHNALGFNALGYNALGYNALGHNALTSVSLSSNGEVLKDLQDPNAREVFSYIVSCALPASQSVSVKVQGTTYNYPGALGVAPEWGGPGGTCDDRCQEWVSACVIARLDYLGQPELISLRGDNGGLVTSPSERATYTSREATYYGNIFVAPMRLYACLPPGKTEIPRVCGPSIHGCPVDVLGPCDDLCGHPRADGSYPNCTAPDPDSCGGRGHRDDTYEGSLTVFLKP